MCNDIKIVWVGCEKQKPKLVQKWRKRPFLDFFDFPKNSLRFERFFIESFYNLIKYYDWDSSESEGKILIRLLYRTSGTGFPLKNSILVSAVLLDVIVLNFLFSRNSTGSICSSFESFSYSTMVLSSRLFNYIICNILKLFNTFSGFSTLAFECWEFSWIP